MARSTAYPLGRLVRDKRQELGLTQMEMAERIGISQAYLSSMERGGVRMPDVEIRRRLADVLRMTHLELLMAIDELSPEEAGQAPRPIVPDVVRKLDALDPASRRAVERVIDDIYSAKATSGADKR